MINIYNKMEFVLHTSSGKYRVLPVKYDTFLFFCKLALNYYIDIFIVFANCKWYFLTSKDL